jgi:hypothetical protein
MATGASKAKREAKKQETKAYYEALNKIERANPVKRIDTQTARKLDNQLDGNMSYGTKRLAMKADKLGRSINADKTLNERIGDFNKRFDEVKRQMKGETITKYAVAETPKTGGMGIGMIGMAALDPANRNVGPRGVGAFDTQEAALSAVPVPEKPKNSFLAMQQQFNAPQGMADFVNGGRSASPIKEVKLGKIDGGYRNLAATKAAYKDLEDLSKNVSNNASAKLTKEYEALGNQLKAKLKRESGTVTGQPQGLLTSELASAAPKQEVIQ